MKRYDDGILGFCVAVLIILVVAATLSLFLSGCSTLVTNVPEDVAVPAAYTADAINWIQFLVR